MTELTIRQNKKMEGMIKDFNCGQFVKGRILIQNIDSILTCGYRMESGEYKIIAKYIPLKQPVFFEAGLTKRESTRVRNIFAIACNKLLQSLNDEEDEEDEEN